MPVVVVAGREFVDETLLPKWFKQFVDFVADAIECRVAPDVERLLSILEKAKISRRLATAPANKLIALIRRVTSKPASRRGVGAALSASLRSAVLGAPIESSRHGRR